jgi:hypothetical protein
MYIAIGSAAVSAVGSAGTAVGWAGTVVGSTAGVSAVGEAQAARTRLATTKTNNNERTVLVISIFLLCFYTQSSYQYGFKDRRRIG